MRENIDVAVLRLHSFALPLHLKDKWYAKRFLHPDIVATYDYILIWDEDLGWRILTPKRKHYENGKMHACSHDTHVAAKLLQARIY